MLGDTLEEKDWQNLLRLIDKGKCTPFIGAGACFGALPMAKEIAGKWAKEHNYPLKDSAELSRVAQFMSIDQYEMFPKECFRDEFQDKSSPDFSKPDEPHAILADLNLPIYITTNYDPFMMKALESRKKHPKRDFCRWNRFDEVVNIRPVVDSSYEPSAEMPLVYHLHGYTDVLQSMVLTESDYLDFLIRFQDKSDPLLLPEITKALTTTTLLFVGYSLADWNFRVLFRGLIGSLQSNLGYFTIAVQLPPDDLTGQELEELSTI